MSDRFDVIVVGGGQAGLAMGSFLREQQRRFAILEAADAPGAAWRSRWDSLRLFTPARYDSLPGRPFPGDPNAYPGRDDVVAYLTEYARALDLPVALNRRVRSIRRREGGYVVEAGDDTYEATQVVIATGPFQVPFLPPAAAGLGADVFQVHSADYRAPSDVPPGPVLVVGGGNTGFQIAEELARSRRVGLAIGSRQLPLPQRILGRDLFRYLVATGLMEKTAGSRIGRRMREREALIGSSPRSARRRHGIQLHPRVTDAAGAEVSFSDGSRLAVDAVVWATGFRLDHSWIDVPVFDERGMPVQERGVTASPGLYFLGLAWQHSRGSALLGWVQDDARHLAQQIAALEPPGGIG